MRAIATAGYETATPIQLQAIPPLLDGYDLMGCAQTGTGKTAAFALPTLQRLAHKSKSATPGARTNKRPIRALVLAPTRELAAQIEQSFTTYGKYLELRVAVIHGGVSQVPQVRAMERGVDIVVATPGRLLDLMNQRVVDLSHLQVLILDEADQMFDMGFLRDIRRILSRVPVDRQTLMFSATMPDEIRKLADDCLYEPKYVEVTKVSSATTLVAQSVFHVSNQNKSKLLTSYLRSCGATRSLVFSRTKHGADDLVKILMKSGIDAVAIHGNKSQNARTRHLEQFKSNRPPVLVATDIAARGIDVSGVTHVINYQLPDVPEVYVHRIGRTGRAEATGIAVSFCGPDERDSLRAIERLINQPIEVNSAFAELTQKPEAFSSSGRSSASSRNKPARSSKRSRPAQQGLASRRPKSAGSRNPRRRDSRDLVMS